MFICFQMCVLDGHVGRQYPQKTVRNEAHHPQDEGEIYRIKKLLNSKATTYAGKNRVHKNIERGCTKTIHCNSTHIMVFQWLTFIRTTLYQGKEGIS